MVVFIDNKIVIEEYTHTDERFNKSLVDLDSNMTDLKELFCDIAYNVLIEDEDYDGASVWIKNSIESIDKITSILNDIISEYYDILSKQIDLLNINEYHLLKIYIINHENYIGETTRKLREITKNLLMLNLNILKRRNYKDVCKMIKDTGYFELQSDEFETVPSEEFILEGEYLD